MILSKKVPATIKVPVAITDNELEIWYARPVSLGKVDKVGNFWYTVDGMRFTNSRNAMEYLITAYEEGRTLVPRRVEPKAKLRVARKARKPKIAEGVENPIELDLANPLVVSFLELLKKHTRETREHV